MTGDLLREPLLYFFCSGYRRNGRGDISDYLLENKANPNVYATPGMTFLLNIACSLPGNEDIILKLLYADSDPNLTIYVSPLLITS